MVWGLGFAVVVGFLNQFCVVVFRGWIFTPFLVLVSLAFLCVWFFFVVFCLLEAFLIADRSPLVVLPSGGSFQISVDV